MKYDFYSNLVTPETHNKLTKSRRYLTDESSGTRYQIVCGVPVMLPENVSADWHRELIEVLLWQFPDEINALYSEIDWSKPPEVIQGIYKRYIDKNLKDKQGITIAFEAYAADSTEKWIAESKKAGSLEKTIDFLRYAKKSVGKKRLANKHNGSEIYNSFSNEVNKNAPANILELATGAGGGTALAAMNMPNSSNLYTLDIGFDCLGNAVGIGKYLNKNIYPVCANFWYLPFDNSFFDTVCTYCGLDESRENEKTISEVSRVLKHGGRFVCMSRKNSAMRQSSILSSYGFSDGEIIDMMKKCRLYSDHEYLAETCKKYRMSLFTQSEFKIREGLVFTLSVFKK